MLNNQEPVAIQQLSKSSTEEQIKQYFQGIVALNNSSEEFPINLDDIWPIAYSRKDHAVRQLLMDFYEGIDFCVQSADNQFFPKNGERTKGGRFNGSNKNIYCLSVSCAEYLVVRKSRQIFEVYRRIFHKVVNEGTNLMGLGKYYTMEEFCKMFGKTKHSFYGYMGNYREEFAMIGHVYYISKRLCMYLESRQSTEKMRISIREKSEKRQLSLQFKDDDTEI